MTLNSSGPISLGGSVTGQSINLEVLQTATTQVSLNDDKVRALAQVPTGAITMPTNFWGKKFSASSAAFFMMGGGGAGGSPYNDGGGAGQMVGQNTGITVSVAQTTYTVTVGAAGSASSVFGYTAVAGGSGGKDFVACGSGGNGGNGACGGGGGSYCGVATNCSGGAPTVAGGTYGGAGLSTTLAGGNGGGGGLGGAGASAYRSGGTNYGGNGGASVTSTFNATGAATHYGGGAPGNWYCGSGDPQAGGFWPDNYYGPNTGYGTYSGVVIIRVSSTYPQPASTGSPTVVNSGGYWWFTFTGSGSITF